MRPQHLDIAELIEVRFRLVDLLRILGSGNGLFAAITDRLALELRGAAWALDGGRAGRGEVAPAHAIAPGVAGQGVRGSAPRAPRRCESESIGRKRGMTLGGVRDRKVASPWICC